MIIGIDGNEANVKERVGVSAYTLSLLEYFSSHANSKIRFSVYLRKKPLFHMPKQNENFTYEVVPSPLLWSQIALPTRLFLKKDIDVFFSPAHYAPRFCPAPLVVTIHDLSYFYYPQEFLKQDLYKLEHWTHDSVTRAKKVIAVSNYTKKDLIKFYRLPDQKISVIHNGFKSASKSIPGIKTEKYILYVGTMQPRKNIQTLVKAFELFQKKHKDYKLVIVGKKGWLYDSLLEQINQSFSKKSIEIKGYVSDQELRALYKNAFCFVMPSLYEGFGIPLLEAMSHGCPVITSNVSSLPEIGADACLYFNPHKTHELEEKLNTLAEKVTLRKELVEKGFKRVRQFSWEKCARATLEVLMSVANG